MVHSIHFTLLHSSTAVFVLSFKLSAIKIDWLYIRFNEPGQIKAQSAILRYMCILYSTRLGKLFDILRNALCTQQTDTPASRAQYPVNPFYGHRFVSIFSQWVSFRTQTLSEMSHNNSFFRRRWQHNMHFNGCGRMWGICIEIGQKGLDDKKTWLNWVVFL